VSAARRLPWVFRALLRLLPREFRGDFGDAMAADIADRRQDVGPATLLRREAPVLLTTALREHLHLIGRDVRYAVRAMRSTPAFTALAIAMLAVGTGANVAMFSVIDAVLLRSPFPDPDRLAIVQVRDDAGRASSFVPTEDYLRLAASPGPLAAVAALDGGQHVLTGSGDTRRIDVECVTASMFDVFAVRPWMGRTFTTADDHAGAAPVMVIAEDFWRELGAPAGIVGSTLTLNSTPVTVIGVMPRGLSGAYSRADTRGWLPLHKSVAGGGLAGCELGPGVNVFARLSPGLSVAAADAALEGFDLLSQKDQLSYGLKTPFVSLAIAVGCVLLVACLNVGGLQMERTLARRRDMALRLALGASRSRLIRQTLTENLVLALCGAIAGVVATALTLGGLVSLLPANLPYLSEIAINGRVLLVAVVAAGAAGIISGLIPVLQTRAFNPLADLNGSGRGATRGNEWTRRAFVVTEIALSVIILIGAGLMIRTFATLSLDHPGFEPEGKLVTLVRIPAAHSNQSPQLLSRLLDQMRATPGVRAVTGSSYLPVSGTVATAALTYNGTKASAWGAVILPNYPEVMEIPIISGRALAASDTAETPRVAIVNEALARRLRPDGQVVGQVVSAPPPRGGRAPAVDWRIVGVMADTRSRANDTRPQPEFYVSYGQHPIPLMQLMVDADRRQHAGVSAEMRRAVQSLTPDMAVEPVAAFTTLLGRRIAHKRFGAWLLTMFAGMALLLAAVGLAMTMGWWVSQRTRELGVRMALGASRHHVTAMILKQGLALAGAGVVTGCVAAAFVTRYLEGWIYGVAPLDRPTFLAAAALMLVVAVAAVYWPMRRAVRVDPVVALRAE
jgi:predicted permease